MDRGDGKATGHDDLDSSLHSVRQRTTHHQYHHHTTLYLYGSAVIVYMTLPRATMVFACSVPNFVCNSTQYLLGWSREAVFITPLAFFKPALPHRRRTGSAAITRLKVFFKRGRFTRSRNSFWGNKTKRLTARTTERLLLIGGGGFVFLIYVCLVFTRRAVWRALFPFFPSPPPPDFASLFCVFFLNDQFIAVCDDVLPFFSSFLLLLSRPRQCGKNLR